MLLENGSPYNQSEYQLLLETLQDTVHDSHDMYVQQCKYVSVQSIITVTLDHYKSRQTQPRWLGDQDSRCLWRQ